MGIDKGGIRMISSVNNFLSELCEQVQKAENEAFRLGIKTNTVVLNEEFDYCKSFIVQNKYVSPMIMGKHIFVTKLPSEYSFVLTQIDEKKLQSELEYYKNKCEMLEQRLEKIKGELELSI